MKAKSSSNVPGHGGVVDSATLYLCRQGQRWVVVIESPLIQGALRLRHTGRDPYDARFELLCSARRACPDAAILSTDGALEDADYEWRLDMRGLETNAGDMGVAVHRELTTAPAPHVRRPSQRQIVSRCHWGRFPEVSGRPRAF
jgi:hypothetical protein